MDDVEIGFAFLERFWAHGYAYESAAAVMEYGRIAPGLERIAATSAPGSRGSLGVLEKLGLCFQGTIHLEGHEGETGLYVVGG
jgi:RimJ/RimL family protein N-acetyltransferase